MDKVEILLSVYNGEKFLQEQLISIENQTITNWSLIARDDGSSDRALKILKEFKKKHPEKVNILQDSGNHLGICKSYTKLMEEATANYIMFCDQDDVWLPQKIDKTLLEMKKLEDENDALTPLLVHCNLIVVDEKMVRRHESFWSYQGIKPGNAGRLNRQLVMNAVTGCSMMINQALLKLSTPIPSEAMVHDWWVAITAAAFGRVGLIKDPLILYRQHGGNQIGARRYAAVSLKNVKRYRLIIQGQLKQGMAFYEKHKNFMSVENVKLFDNYFRLYEVFPVLRFIVMIKNGFLRSGILRNIAMGVFFKIKPEVNIYPENKNKRINLSTKI